jgi:hypothetical protein
MSLRKIDIQTRVVPCLVRWATIRTRTGQVLLRFLKHLGSSLRLLQTSPLLYAGANLCAPAYISTCLVGAHVLAEPAGRIQTHNMESSSRKDSLN